MRVNVVNINPTVWALLFENMSDVESLFQSTLHKFLNIYIKISDLKKPDIVVVMFSSVVGLAVKKMDGV